MRFLLSLLAAIVLSLALGLGSAWYMVAAPRTGTVAAGSWEGLPTLDAETADPYMRARVARTGEIGMGAGEGLTFVADRDDGRHRLVADCVYELTGVSPAARLWTLTASDAAGRLGTAPGGRTFLDSRDLLRDGDGRFTIAVSATARPGNWLATPSRGAFVLTLRLYDTPLMPNGDRPPDLPTIERRTCR